MKLNMRLGNFFQKTTSVSPMIILGHQGESFILKLLISCIKDKEEIQVWVVFGEFPFVLKFSNFSFPVFSVFSFFFCLVSHILATG